MKKWILPIAVCALVLGFSESAQAGPPRVVVGVSNFGGGFYQPSYGVNYATRVGNNGIISVGYGAPVYNNFGYNYGVTQFGVPGYSYRSFYSTPYATPFVAPAYGYPVYPSYGYGYGSRGIIIR